MTAAGSPMVMPGELDPSRNEAPHEIVGGQIAEKPGLSIFERWLLQRLVILDDFVEVQRIGRRPLPPSGRTLSGSPGLRR